MEKSKPQKKNNDLDSIIDKIYLRVYQNIVGDEIPEQNSHTKKTISHSKKQEKKSSSKLALQAK
ncbi:MAG TPA: hypothetical protein PLE74_01655 [Candidatus Cloacimonadota bacterium]|nr:hypothetical protein [Candidatus Cloacimonadota bacterium]HPT70971.1 hypothetical protein [Candidatus Cloacimonadota bacterium]